MHPQLLDIIEELGDATRRLGRLSSTFDEAAWHRRVDPARWSPAECVAHLNLTNSAFLPSLRAKVDEGRARGGSAPARYRRDPMGWLLWRMMPPPVRLRVPSSAGFIPESSLPRDEVLATFSRLQDELIAVISDADGLPLQKLRIRSPFDNRASYNLFSAFGILARHEHRHLWQAEGSGK